MPEQSTRAQKENNVHNGDRKHGINKLLAIGKACI